MKNIIKKILQFSIGKILSKIYKYYLETHNWIPSFLRTPRALDKFYQLMIEYKTDLEQYKQIEYFDTSLEVLNSGSADCDGASIFFKDLLLSKYQAEMYTITVLKVDIIKEFKAHRTCIFLNKDYTYSSIDNAGLSYPVTFYRVRDAGKYLAKKVYGDEYNLFEIKKVD